MRAEADEATHVNDSHDEENEERGSKPGRASFLDSPDLASKAEAA